MARIVGNQIDAASTQAVEILQAAREIATKVAGPKAGDCKVYIAQAAQAVEQFDAQAKLQELAKSGGRRARAVINDAVARSKACTPRSAAPGPTEAPKRVPPVFQA